MDGKWNDKWEIMVRKWMKDILISDGKNGQFQGPTDIIYPYPLLGALCLDP